MIFVLVLFFFNFFLFSMETLLLIGLSRKVLKKLSKFLLNVDPIFIFQTEMKFSFFFIVFYFICCDEREREREVKWLCVMIF